MALCWARHAYLNHGLDVGIHDNKMREKFIVELFFNHTK